MNTPAKIPEPCFGADYMSESPAPYKWEAMWNKDKKTCLQTVLTRIERAPHQIAFIQSSDGIDILARRTDRPAPVIFACIFTGLTLAEAERLRAELKAEGWKPSKNIGTN